MDITFRTDSRVFNYRVCAVFLHDGAILAMQDARSPYYYLPGGRVRMGETAEDAVLREVREELGASAKIVRPLWLNQAFFNEDVDHRDYHELCIYFLMQDVGGELAARGTSFAGCETHKGHIFTWLPFAALAETYFYPNFLKTEIFSLPETLQIRKEYE